MTKPQSKKQLILEFRQAHALERASEAELREIATYLQNRLAAAGKTSWSYIANVLRQAGVFVDYRSVYVDVEMEEPYAGALQHLLHFGSLESAENSLRQLDAAYRRYQSAADPRGVQCVRALVRRGKDRAASLAASPRVSPEKRQEKQEIAAWFRTWLETPDLFFDWLEVRKQTGEFQQRFTKRDEPAEEHSQKNRP